MVERPLVVHWVVGSSPHGGPTTGVTKAMLCAVLSVGTLTANRKG